MKLQILVPHYNETAEEVKPLLDSIALQQNVDFGEIGVILCHDGEDIPDLDIAPPLPVCDQADPAGAFGRFGGTECLPGRGDGRICHVL